MPLPHRRFDRLDALRGFAAFYVVVTHSFVLDSLGLGPLSAFGQEAVILFFLLSGFLISHTSEPLATAGRFGRYFLSRAKRIYPLFLAALLLAYVNMRVRCYGSLPVDGRQLAGNLLMMQDFSQAKAGVWFGTFCANVPLWSLSYEWWFYMLFFPTVFYLRRWPSLAKYVIFAVALSLSVLYQWHPNQVSLFLGYFPIWWAGVEMSREYRHTGRVTFARHKAMLLMLACLATVWAVPVIMAARQGVPLSARMAPVLQFRHLASAIALMVIGISWHKMRFAGFAWTVGRFMPLARISYALYLVHLPVMWYGRYFETVANPLLRFALYLAVIFPVCYVLEYFLQPAVDWAVLAVARAMEQRRTGLAGFPVADGARA